MTETPNVSKIVPLPKTDPDQRESWVWDTHGNLIERFADNRIRVSLSPQSTRTADDVAAWYWAYVGEPPPDQLP